MQFFIFCSKLVLLFYHKSHNIIYVYLKVLQNKDLFWRSQGRQRSPFWYSIEPYEKWPVNTLLQSLPIPSLSCLRIPLLSIIHLYITFPLWLITILRVALVIPILQKIEARRFVWDNIYSPASDHTNGVSHD